MGRQREYDDDDGRTIVDMSGVEAPSMLGFRAPDRMQEKHKKRNRRPEKTPESSCNEELYPWANNPFTPKERLRYTLVALKAALLIGGIFLAAGALLIWFLTLVW